MLAIFASWSLLITGKGRMTCFSATLPVLRRLPLGPIALLRLVTSSSRIASSGGFVTWAKDWTK